MPSPLSISCRNRTLVMALSLALLAGFQALGIANLKNKPMGKSAYHLLRHFSEYVNAFSSLAWLSYTHTQQTSFRLRILLSFGESKWFKDEAMFLLLESFTDCEFRCVHDHRGNKLPESSVCEFASSHCPGHWRGQYIHSNLYISTYCSDMYFGRVEFESFDLRNDHCKEREERCVRCLRIRAI